MDPGSVSSIKRELCQISDLAAEFSVQLQVPSAVEGSRAEGNQVSRQLDSDMAYRDQLLSIALV
jgi:hypothetical protein